MKIFGTAKGGAISKKNFGVAFGGNGATPSSEITQENQNDNMGLLKDGTAGFGYIFEAGHDLIDKEVTSVSFYVKTYPDKPITEGVISVYCGQNQTGTSGNVLIGSIDGTEFSTTTFEWKEFTGIATKTITDDDQIWIQYSVAGDERLQVSRYYDGAVPPEFWGNGGVLPTGNDAGTTNAGDTISCYSSGGITTGIAPSAEESTPAHVTAIKISYE